MKPANKTAITRLQQYWRDNWYHMPFRDYIAILRKQYPKATYVELEVLVRYEPKPKVDK